MPLQPLRYRAAGMLLAVAIPAIVWNPRSAAFIAPAVLILAVLSLGPARPAAGLLSLRASALTLWGSLLLAYALVGCTWSASPGAAAPKVAMAILLALCVAQLNMGVRSAGARARHQLVRWVWIAYCIAILVALADVVSMQALKQAFLAAFGIDTAEVVSPRFIEPGPPGVQGALRYEALSRHAAPILLFLWPAMMAAAVTLDLRYRRALMAGTGALAAITLVALPLETAKLALLVGALALGCARLRPRLAVSLAAAAWCALCVGFPLMSLAAHRLDLQNAVWLPESARHRIVIWNDLSSRIREAPVFGLGTEALYISSARDRPQAPLTDARFPHRVRHAHSVFLQTWAELGLVGVALLLASGLAMLRTISRLHVQTMPLALGGFAAGSILLSATFGIWQPWLLGLLSLAFAIFAVTAQVQGEPVRQPEAG